MNFKEHLTKRNLLFSLSFSFIFTFFYYIGYKLEKYSDLFHKEASYSVILICFITIFLGYFLITLNYEKINNFLSKIKIPEKIENQFLKPNLKCFFSCFIFIGIFSLFALFAHFPGIVAYDVPFQIGFFDFGTKEEVHPFLHNLIVYGAYLLNKNLNSEYIGIFAYSIFQSTIMVGIFSYCIYFLAKYNVSSIIKLLTLLYFAFYPIHNMYLITITKDVLFAGFVLLFITNLIDLNSSPKAFFNNKLKCTGFIFIIFLVLNFRLNAIWGYWLSLPFFLFFFKKHFKKALILFLIPLLFTFSFNYIKKLTGIKPAPKASTLSIPIQQMGRVRLMQDEKLPEEEKLAFRNIVSEKCELKYNKYSADPLKIDNPAVSKVQLSLFIDNSLKTNPQNFYNLYFNWLKKYPKDYINAALLTNYTYWHTGSKYTKIFLHLNFEPSSVFVVNSNTFMGYKNVLFGKKCLNIFAWMYYNFLFTFNNFENYNLLFILFSYACNLWVLISCAFLLINKKKYQHLIVFIFPFFLVLTVIFSPTALLRYVYYNYLILPVVLALTFSKFKND